MKFVTEKTNTFFKSINKEVLHSVTQQQAEYYIPSGSTSYHPLYGEETSDTLFILGDTFYTLVMTQDGFVTNWVDIGYDAEASVKVFILREDLEDSDLTEFIPGSVWRFTDKLTYRTTLVYDSSEYSYVFANQLANWYKFYIICECKLVEYDKVHIVGD